MDWATAEDIAFASILQDGIAIRLTGQDTARGTFSQRHAVFYDAQTNKAFIPLQALPQAQASFEVLNSPLSEMGAIGFEIGYNIQSPGRLDIWEAQYGDFVNNAQGVIDEFLVSGRAKWGLTPSLVLLLPHGNEGMGPDHSSGRIERFLALAAETNMRIAYPSTAAQYFHLLRRQALLLKNDPLPLIVFTPKGLLRHPLVASAVGELADGAWQPVMDDAEVEDPKSVTSLILCSGRIYVDLVTSQLRKEMRQCWPDPPRTALPLPERGLGKFTRAVHKSRAADLGSGGAVEHGRLELSAPTAAPVERGSLSIALCRPARKLEPGRGIIHNISGQPAGLDRAGV